MKNIYLFLILIIISILCGCVENSFLNTSNLTVEDFKVVNANESLINKIKSSSPIPYSTKSSVDILNIGDRARYSKTNVQEEGIDEGDIVKTDGKYIYFSRELVYRLLNEKIIPPYYDTLIINAYPPKNMSIVSKISDSGKLYYINNTLIVINPIKRQISAYNVSNPKNVSVIWKLNLNGSYVDSRLYNGRLYLIIRQYSIDYPIIWNNIKIDKCYIPIAPSYNHIDYKNTYIISKINYKNGKVEDIISTVGSYSTTVYMSKKNIYFTYYLRANENRLFIDFIYKNADRYFPNDISSTIKKVYEDKLFDDLPKYIQIKIIIERCLSKLPEKDRINLLNRINKDYESYLEEKLEELESTGILKISIDNFAVKSGKVPGRLLNQFSMSEYNGYLRVATTIGNRWKFRDKSINNIYVLDKDLKIVGKLTGLSKGKRIYAVRFLGNIAYIITYRETDPLYVVDLSNPKKPKLLEELKLSGYSTYLHPIDNNKLIGIGKSENNRLKISLYDISDLKNPKILDSYILPEYWSISLYNHHAFLYDKDKKILVLPVSNKGYIFKIDNNITLKYLDKHSSEVLRALYIGNYLYVISSSEIHSIDENNFSLVGSLNIN